MMAHLWETKHPYYCNEGNYYAPSSKQPTMHFRSWADFIAEFQDSDFDYNFLFRWDWREGSGWDLPEFNGDENYRNGKLMICWMGQRKGLYSWSTVEVCRADEPAVREFLVARWKYMREVWAPISGAQPEGDGTDEANNSEVN